MPTDLPAVEKFCALLRPIQGPGRGKPIIVKNWDQLTAQLLGAARQLPPYQDLQNQLNTIFFANRHLDPEATRYLGLETISTYLLDQDRHKVQTHPLLDVLHELVSKGYGQLPSKPNAHPNAFLQIIGHTPIFHQWVSQQDREPFLQFMSAGQLDASNITWILSEKPELASDPPIFTALCLRVGSAMDQAIARKDWTGKKRPRQNNPASIDELSSIACSLKTYTTKVPPEVHMEAWYGIVGKSALLHPQWVLNVFGENPTFREFSLPDTLDNRKLGCTFIEKSGVNTDAWEKEIELFRKMVQQIPYLGDISSELSELDSPVLFSLYLDHPSISDGPRFNHCGHSLQIINNLEGPATTTNKENHNYLAKVEECVEKIYQVGGNLSAFDFYQLVRAGFNLETVKKALHISHRERSTEHVSFAWIVEADRPELLSLFPEHQIPWVRVGAHLPTAAMTLTSKGIQAADTPWKNILEGPHGKSCRNGFLCARILGENSNAPGFIRQHPWLRDQELGEAVLNTRLLGKLGKRVNVHTALETAATLQLKPSTMSREGSTFDTNKESYAPKEATLLELVAASNKPNFLLRYRDLGGKFTSHGLEAAIEAKKPQNLEIMLAAPYGSMSKKLPEKYLEKIEDRISPTLLKLVKICQPDPLSLLRALSGYHHHGPDLSLLYGLMLEQNNPQSLFTEMVQQGGPICEQHPELLRQTIYHGANPSNPVWVYDYNGFAQKSLPDLLPQIQGSNCANLGYELIELYKAHQQARQGLRRPDSLEIELF